MMISIYALFGLRQVCKGMVLGEWSRHRMQSWERLRVQTLVPAVTFSSFIYFDSC